MAQHAVQITIDDVIRQKKREERKAEQEARELRRQRRAATAGTPLLQEAACAGEEASHG